MERYVLLVWTLVYIYVTFAYAEETKEMANSVQRLKSPESFVCICTNKSLHSSILISHVLNEQGSGDEYFKID